VAEPARVTGPDRLAGCRLYLCLGPHPRLGALVAAVTAAGVGAVQYRDKTAEWSGLAAGLAAVRAAAAPGTLVSANDRADLAACTGADILHVGQDDIPPARARPLVGAGMLIGRSCHDRDQVERALADPDVDYFCVGPTWATPTKPGRPAAGLELTRWVAGLAPAKPWFAIGGIDAGTLPQVLDAGASRAVVVRVLTEAPSPAAAAEAAAALHAALTAAAPASRPTPPASPPAAPAAPPAAPPAP
jgi:thiamine-phosphate pyrophosphorylase